MDIIKPDVYLFGQVLGTHSFLLKDGFLQPDEYAEIGAQYFLPAEYFIEPTRFSTCVRDSLFGIMFWNSREK